MGELLCPRVTDTCSASVCSVRVLDFFCSLVSLTLCYRTLLFCSKTTTRILAAARLWDPNLKNSGFAASHVPSCQLRTTTPLLAPLRKRIPTLCARGANSAFGIALRQCKSS